MKFKARLLIWRQWILFPILGTVLAVLPLRLIQNLLDIQPPLYWNILIMLGLFIGLCAFFYFHNRDVKYVDLLDNRIEVTYFNSYKANNDSLYHSEINRIKIYPSRSFNTSHLYQIDGISGQNLQFDSHFVPVEILKKYAKNHHLNIEIIPNHDFG
ncbi:hypothetical protein KFE98_03495 [bacterium SCSIO 12741]|nr:hypothetical protein KFE98_03495 [bacterium SCSIO 12741]